LYDGWWVCISVRIAADDPGLTWITTAAGTASIPTVTGTYTPTTITPVDASFTASPVQDGIVSGCKAFYQAKDVSAAAPLHPTRASFFVSSPSMHLTL
jgi:hypothetical protein